MHAEIQTQTHTAGFLINWFIGNRDPEILHTHYMNQKATLTSKMSDLLQLIRKMPKNVQSMDWIDKQFMGVLVCDSLFNVLLRKY